MVIRLGMIGFNDGNGHPFSFSAILNGYDDAAMRAAGWAVIADYLVNEQRSSFATLDARVVCAWGPKPSVTLQLQRACYVDRVLERPEEMVGDVDAVLIARDDWECHEPLAMPFLAEGMPVFVDKPLSLDPAQIRRLRPHLESGRLCSWSGLRFSRELRSARLAENDHAVVAYAAASWDRYAIHVIEPALSIMRGTPRVATHVAGKRPEAVSFECDDGTTLTVEMLGSELGAGFRLEISGDRGIRTIELRDRFAAFKASLEAFIGTAITCEQPPSSELTLTALRAVIAGRRALDDRAPIKLVEVDI